VTAGVRHAAFSVRQRSLAGGIAAALLFSAAMPPEAFASGGLPRAAGNTPDGTLVVTNCDDSGPGSLRDAVASAISGETIDLTQLSCSTITLTSGAIDVLLDDLSLTGPGAANLTIDGSSLDRVFTHNGSGTLRIDGLALTNGYYVSATNYAEGGCVYSIGDLAVYGSAISHCTVSGSVYALGGGIYVYGDIHIVDSIVMGCLAEGTVADGGGVQVVGNAYLTHAQVTNNTARATKFTSAAGLFVILGNLTMQYSTLAYNDAYAPMGGFSLGAAIHSFGDVTILNSTIFGNTAYNVAGLVLEAYHNTPTATIVDSTISGNGDSSTVFGAVYTAIPLAVYNSTIAFNLGSAAGGVYAYGPPATLESSIVATNTGQDLRLGRGATVSGSHNIIETAITVPPDTIRSDPLLLPLAGNGGPTITHALQAGSPAINAGSNVRGLATDQRGDGYPRVTSYATDIGAFESAFIDRIFADGFDGVAVRSAR
jgi:hypothetical protein